MPLQSMTGFGHGQARSSIWNVEVEMRSVNQKALDVRVHSNQRIAYSAEAALVELVKASIRRGRVDVRLHVEKTEEAALVAFDDDRVASLNRQLQRIVHSHALTPVTLSDILLFREAITDEDSESLPEDLLSVATRDALAGLLRTRLEEGEKTATWFASELTQIRDRCEEIALIADGLTKELGDRLREKLRKAWPQESIGIPEDRLMQEIVIYSDKADITEEIERTRSHLSQLREILYDASDEPRGKKLDFYLQELFREANTMASKSASVEITNAVVEIKSSIEKLREQTANLE